MWEKLLIILLLIVLVITFIFNISWFIAGNMKVLCVFKSQIIFILFKAIHGFIQQIKTFNSSIRMKQTHIACKAYICLLSGHLIWCIYCWECFYLLAIFSVVFIVFFIRSIKLLFVTSSITRRVPILIRKTTNNFLLFQLIYFLS